MKKLKGSIVKDDKSHVMEEERLKTLYRYEILDTPRDGTFDRLTAITAKLFNVPIAIVSLVDNDRIWFKSRYGIETEQVGCDPGLCASAILSDEVYVIEDARNDIRSLANPLVASNFGLQFYAGAPLQTKDGYNLGTLCIIDRKQRKITEEQKEMLDNLAGIVMDEMELRLSARKATRLQRELLSIAAHDLKNPITGILGLSEIMIEEDNIKSIIEIAGRINKSSKKMLNIINELMEVSTIDAGKIKLKINFVNMAELAEDVVESNRVSAEMKQQELKLKVESKPVIRVDKERMREVFDNLVSNAIKYSEKGKKIEVSVKEASGKAYFEVKDEGQGLTEEDKFKLYGRFSRLSAQPTAGETSTGLGLSIAKMLVELHKGKIWAESEGRDKGSKFIVELPSL